jgi:hypothetical protein
MDRLETVQNRMLLNSVSFKNKKGSGYSSSHLSYFVSIHKRRKSMKHILLILSLFIVLSASPVISFADQTSHRKAAEDLLSSMNINQTMTETVDIMVELEIEKNPQLSLFKDVMRGFFLKYMTGDVLINFLSGVYMEEFTENELIEITNFYKTPTGKKAIKKLPLLTQKGARWGEKQVSDNIDELRRLITEESKRLEKIKKSSPQ